MAVKLVTSAQRWIGLSTDTKPIATAALTGAGFYETNTGQDFICNGSEWVEDITLIYALAQALKEGGK